MRRALVLAAVLAVGLGVTGSVVADAVLDQPQDAVPVQSDPIADLLRQTPAPVPTPSAAPAEAAPAGTPAPAAPIAITSPEGAAAVTAAIEEDDEEAEDEAPVKAAAKSETAIEPGRRQRRRVAIVQAIDKITAESMRFEVEVGGRPVRFNRNLIFTARACEVSTSDELTDDAIAYLEVSLQPRGTLQTSAPRQIFRGWMFASSPGVSSLQHPTYDAWVVGCKA